MKKGKKRVLIIVRGAKPIHFKNRFFENTKKFLWKKLTASRGLLTEGYLNVADFLGKDYDAVELLKWDGNIIQNPSLSLPVNELKEILKKYKKEDIDIIAVSIGGLIAQKALAGSKNLKIKKLLYIGAVHNGHHELKNVNEMINVYSLKDKMFEVANDFYEGFGNAHLKGSNVLNIVLNSLKHDELLLNKLLKGENIPERHLFELYRNLLIRK